MNFDTAQRSAVGQILRQDQAAAGFGRRRYQQRVPVRGATGDRIGQGHSDCIRRSSGGLKEYQPVAYLHRRFSSLHNPLTGRCGIEFRQRLEHKTAVEARCPKQNLRGNLVLRPFVSIDAVNEKVRIEREAWFSGAASDH